MTPTERSDIAAPGSLRAALVGLLDRAEAAGGEQATVRIGPTAISVRSPRRLYLDQAAAHTFGDPQTAPWPPLTIHLVDGAHLSIESLPGELRSSAARGPTTLFRDGDTLGYAGDGMLWIVDLASGRAMRWSPSPTTLPVWEAIRPLRFAIKTWAARHGGALLHAGAVGGRSGAALLVGPSGTGKSTTSLACLGRGLPVLADDYCISMTQEPGGPPSVCPTYLVGHLDSRSLELLPHLQARVTGIGPLDKRLVPLDPLPDAALALPLTAVCTIVRSPGETTRLVPISRSEALRILAPSTLLQIPGSPHETWNALTALIRHVQAFRLHVGDLAAVPGVLAELLGDTK
jgi:hypothetical protein